MNKRTQLPQRMQSKSAPAKNRGVSLRYIVFAIGLILGARLFYLQVIKHDYYDKLAVAEQQKKFTIPAERGSVYFRDGDQIVPAVLNSDVYTLYADPREVIDAKKAAKVVSNNLNLDTAEVLKKIKTKDTSYVVLAKRLSRDSVDKLFKEKKQLIGINVVAVPQRVYPEGTLAAQTLGFVNDEGIGQYGAEGALNSRLKGSEGILKATTDVNGVPLSVDDRNSIAKAPKNGDDLVLTVDRNIQAKAEEVLATGLERSKATKGSIIVIDPSTGAVKAMANLPTYDPAKYFDVGDDAYEKFQNRVVSSPYEAGSVIKTLTMSAGLNQGVVTKDSRFNNTGSVKVADATIKNVAQEANGSRTMTDVLKYSLNTGVVHVLSQLGGGSINQQARTTLYDYFTGKYGFGTVTGLEQAGEASGSIFGPNTEQGNNVRYSNMAFGHGMDVTMVQTAAAFSSVVNGGKYFQPHIVEGTLGSNGEVESKIPKPLRDNVVNQTTSDQITEMTRTALRESPAVARFVRAGYNVGGKTGTSQTIDASTGKYTDKNTIGSYLGFGGDTKPRYVIMVRVDDSQVGEYAGSASAAPIFGELSNWLIDYYNIKPL
ncbi:penicillin-binding protein 2 [Candidatus Saccharibacteria bacterium]|nr:penicillin-binding protein 2 [Candidatus Saccharibacteria bacterium]